MMNSGISKLSPYKKDRMHHAAQSVASVSQKLKNRPKPPPRAVSVSK